MKKLTVKEYFDKYAKEHEEQRRTKYYWYNWMISTIIKEVSIEKGDKILDLGTGSAIIPIKISKKVGRKGEVIGVDASRGMINEGKEAIKKLGFKNIKFKVAYIEDLECKKESFNAVTTSLAIDHVKDKLKMARNVKKWLKPGGKFVAGFCPKKCPAYVRLVNKAIKQNSKEAKKFIDSIWKYFKTVSKEYLTEHPKEYRSDPYKLKTILKKVGFIKVKIIPTYDFRFVIVSAEKKN